MTPAEHVEFWSDAIDDNGLINVGTVCRGQPIWMSYYLTEREPERHKNGIYYVSVNDGERSAFPGLTKFIDVAYTVTQEIDDEGNAYIHATALLNKMTSNNTRNKNG